MDSYLALLFFSIFAGIVIPAGKVEVEVFRSFSSNNRTVFKYPMRLKASGFGGRMTPPKNSHAMCQQKQTKTGWLEKNIPV